MSWLKKVIKGIQTVVKSTTQVPKGTWVQCQACKNALFRTAFEENFSVCSCCGYHHRIRARKRLEQLLDSGTGQELAKTIEAVDRLKFKDQHKYKERLDRAKRETGEKEALLVMQGQLEGISVICSAFEFGFMGGSMGAAVGTRFVQAVEKALELNCPLICVAASGGARMQEGLFSLIQMAKTSAVLGKLKQAGLPFISVLTDPTMGGVSASFASLGDIIIAEPKALIGFAGPRVIEQTVHQVLPSGFQRSEFLLAHGGIDMVVERKDLKPKIARLLRKLMYTHQAAYALSVKSSCDYLYNPF